MCGQHREQQVTPPSRTRDRALARAGDDPISTDPSAECASLRMTHCFAVAESPDEVSGVVVCTVVRRRPRYYGDSGRTDRCPSIRWRDPQSARTASPRVSIDTEIPREAVSLSREYYPSSVARHTPPTRTKVPCGGRRAPERTVVPAPEQSVNTVRRIPPDGRLLNLRRIVG